jgi:1-acyl-sn-glycerol-3-phosphate acyltransferase
MGGEPSGASENGQLRPDAPGDPFLPEGIGRLQGVARLLCSPVFRFCWRVEVEGLEHVPTTGPAVICPNHISVIDSFLLPWVLPRPMTFVGKAEYLDDWKTRKLFPALGMIPIDRRGGDQAKAALDAARSVLLRGELFGIYPEGTRSRDGRLYKGHTGAARLAVEAGAPIIPVGIVGTREIQPPDAPLPRPFRRAVVRFGAPIPSTPYRARAEDPTVFRQYIDDVMFQVRDLCGQEYVDAYAGSVKKTAPPVEAGQAAAVERRSSAEVLRTRPLPAPL